MCDFTDIIDKNFLKGINLDNNNINDFYDKEENMNNYQDFISYNKNFFEEYCSKILKKEVLIKDVNNDTSFDEVYKCILNDFDTFTFYYNITKHKSEQIYIWKNILLSIKLICKYISNELKNFVISKFKSIYKNIQELNINYLIDFEISTLINEFIVGLFILYDLDTKSKDKIRSLFQNNILPYIFAYMLIQKKEYNFKDIELYDMLSHYEFKGNRQASEYVSYLDEILSFVDRKTNQAENFEYTAEDMESQYEDQIKKQET
jgi:hypothetical protein